MLTAYWMVKDDAEGLRHSIASVRENLDADEYVVLDTGSQDGTVAVAEEALSGMNGKPVSIRQQTFPDPMHFGDARNVALQECHGDWVFQIDSDEFITQCDAKALKKLLAETPPEVKLYKVPTLLCGMDPNVPAGHTMLPRLFRQGVQYTFGYHEVPALALEEGRDCHLLTLRHSKEHRAPEREAIRDLQRTECSEKWFTDLEGKEPDEKWRSLMYLGVNRMGHGELESAVDPFREALAMLQGSPNPFAYQLAHYLANTLNVLGKPEEAIPVAQQFVGWDLTRCELALDLGDALCAMALRKNMPNLLELGRHWYELAAAHRGLPISPMFVEIPSHTYLPALKLMDWYTRFAVPEVAPSMRRKWWKEAVARGCPPTAFGSGLFESVLWIGQTDDDTKTYLRRKGVRVDEEDTGDADVRIVSGLETANTGERVIRLSGISLLPQNATNYADADQIVVESFAEGQQLRANVHDTAGKPIHIIPRDAKRGQRFYRILKRPKVHVWHEGQDWQIEARLREVLPTLGCLHVPREQAELVIACQPNYPREKAVPWQKVVFWNTEYLGGANDRQEARRALWGEAAAAADVHIHASEEDAPYPGGACYPYLPDGVEPDLAVLHYGTMNDRRRGMLEALRARDIPITEVHDLDAEAIARWINRSKVVLNLHYYDEGHEFRLWECLSCATYCLSEPVPEWSPMSKHVDQIPWEADNWAERLHAALSDVQYRQKRALAGAEWCWQNFRLDQNLELVLERVGL